MALFDENFIQVVADLPRRVEEIINPWAAETPGAVALREKGRSFSYQALSEAVADAKAFLRASGLRPGDRLVIVGENALTLVALFLAANALRVWPVPVNGRLSDREIEAIRVHADARLTLFVSDDSPATRAHEQRYAARPVSLPRVGSFSVGPENPDALPETALGSDDVAVLIYTSGSTGQPKGVMLTHGNLIYMAAVSGGIRALKPADRLLGVLPLSHIVGLAVILLGGLMHGASIDLVVRFKPGDVLEAMEEGAVSIVLGTPAMYALLLDYAKRKKLSRIAAPSLRIISVSGAPLDPALKEEAETMFGLPLHHGYGITECSPTIAQVRPETPLSDCSVGPLFPGLQAKLTDPSGAPVPPGEPGELSVKGPTVMKGYYRAPEETRAVLDDEGWFRTGDLVRIDRGNLSIVGRAKEIIIRFGFNVYPAEVEAVLASHPAVLQAAIVGVTRDRDEDIIAFVRKRGDQAVSDEELRRFAAERLASYKQPSEIITIDEMPTTSTGKVLKSALLACVPTRSAVGT